VTGEAGVGGGGVGEAGLGGGGVRGRRGSGEAGVGGGGGRGGWGRGRWGRGRWGRGRVAGGSRVVDLDFEAVCARAALAAVTPADADRTAASGTCEIPRVRGSARSAKLCGRRCLPPPSPLASTQNQHSTIFSSPRSLAVCSSCTGAPRRTRSPCPQSRDSHAKVDLSKRECFRLG